MKNRLIIYTLLFLFSAAVPFAPGATAQDIASQSATVDPETAEAARRAVEAHVVGELGSTSAETEVVTEPQTKNEASQSGTLVPDSGNSAIDALLFDSQLQQSGLSAQLKLPITVKKLAKTNFSAQESVNIVITNTFSPDTEITLFNVNGEEVAVKVEIVHNTDPTVFRLLPPAQFTPGRYRVKIKDPGGKVTTQDFTWGVLAINTHKSVYLSNETAQIDMAVLDETGMMVCDADVSLVIKEPAGTSQTLSTKDETIKVNPGCSVKDLVLEPDFETKYQVKGSGVYEMTLTAETTDGTYAIDDKFEVRDSVDFDIERDSATRLFPPVSYPVKVKITANKDFEGTVTETVPFSHTIEPLKGTPEFISVIETPEEKVQENVPQVLGESTISLGLPYKGEFEMSQGFGGEHRDPLLRQKYTDYGVAGHDGLDFELPEGTPVVAVDDGEIARAKENSDYGTTVVIQHEWGKSYYGHLSKLLMKEGEKVTRGQEIALSGNTGLSTGPHLHFGIKPNQNNFDNGYYGKVNPAPYLGLEKAEFALLQSKKASDTSTKTKTITWNVSMKKGETVTLGYSLRVPEISPQFYLAGPLELHTQDGSLAFRESRQWQLAADAIDPITGWITYADTANAGKIKVADMTDNSPSETFGSEVNTTRGAGSTAIYQVRTAADPTSTEISVAYIDSAGTMYVLRCSGSCRTTGNWSELFNVSGLSDSPQNCTTAAGYQCFRPFDIAYEQLTGRLLIVYSKNATNDAFFYRVYNDGSSVIGETQVNDSNLGGDNASFITLRPRGEYLGAYRTNQILAVLQSEVEEVVAHIWSGSAWGNSTHLTSTYNIFDGRAISADGGWESLDSSAAGTIITVFQDGASTAYRYRRYNQGTWESDSNTSQTQSASGNFINLNVASHPNSNRIAVVYTEAAGNDIDFEVWKANGTTAGWNGGGGDASAATANIQHTWVSWARFDSYAIYLGANSGSSFDQVDGTADCDGSGCTFTATNSTDVTTTSCTGGTTIDDSGPMYAAPSWNSDEIMFLTEDIDGNLWTRSWASGTLDARNNTCIEPNLPPNPNNTRIYNWPFSFVWNKYAAWSRNWRFYDDETVNDPTTGLNGAAENTTPTGVDQEEFIRLKMQSINLGELAQTDTRKKLQYTSGCTPNTAYNEILCTWTDVGDTGETSSVWRYATSGETCSSCSDNTAVATPRLTGSEAGVYTSDKDAAGGSNMDHGAAGSATDIFEVDFPLKAEDVAAGTTYYFRMVDYDSTAGNRLVNYRRQDTGTTDCLSSTCTYPSVTISSGGSPTPTMDQLMRHGKWFDSGTEQAFYF